MSYYPISCKNCAVVSLCYPSESLQNKNLLVKKQIQMKRGESLHFSNKTLHLYAISAGSMKAQMITPDGQEYIKHFYVAGELLGFEMIASPSIETFSIIALCETKLCEMPYYHFLNFLISHPEFQHLIFQTISARFHLESWMAYSAEKKLITFLLELSKRLHCENSDFAFHLPMTHHDIGNHLCLTPETISRLLTRLQKLNLLTIKNRKMHLNREKLMLRLRQ